MRRACCILGNFDVLAWRRGWADLIELCDSNRNRVFCSAAFFCSDSTAFVQAKCEGMESMVRLLLEHGAEAQRADE